jgi:DNA-binding XRE family transcriptional regulator
MKMKGQLDSAQPMKKHKAKSKKQALKKKKQAKLEAKKDAKEKKNVEPSAQVAEKRVTAPLKPAAPLRNVPTALTKTAPTTSATSRQRASKSLVPMTKDEQLIVVNQVIKRLLLDEISQGDALRELRVKVLGLRQEAYTALTGVSRKTLSEIENDKGNYTPEIINKVFQPFNLKIGLVPTSSQLLVAILSN